ncbi:MAG: elongation factor P hydroxylase [Myxococcota bacterium]
MARPVPLPAPMTARDLERAFATCFARAPHFTELVGGGDEPFYRASRHPEYVPHRIVYRADYASSALHEVSHWCIAGRRRRTLDDYGYWYVPDGRTEAQQRTFERVEAAPQALESIFADAAGIPFHLSADNLDGDAGSSERFARAVATQRRRFLNGALPPRAAIFISTLRR